MIFKQQFELRFEVNLCFLKGRLCRNYVRTHAFTITLVMQFCPAAFMGVTEPLEGLKMWGGAINDTGNEFMTSYNESWIVYYRLIRFKTNCINGHFTTISGHFFAIFLKTEVLMVLLSSLTGLNLDWYKSYDTKRKNTCLANSPKYNTDKCPFYDHFLPCFCQLY